MCGLVLAVSTTALNSTQTKIFKDLLQMDVVRGKHSTGIFAADKTGVDHFKSVMLPTDLLEHRFVQDLMRSANVLAGHNRHATRGASNTVNAHPFEHGHITLMHNGTIDTHPKMKDQDAFDTDSECIAYNLSNCKNKTEVITFIESLEGAYALIWYDVVDDAVYVARNDQRSLFFTQGENSLYMASERGLLFAALDRATLTLTGTRSGAEATLESIQPVPVGELWKITYKDKIQIDKTPFKPKERYVAPVTDYSSYYVGGRGSYYNRTQNTSNNTNVSTYTSQASAGTDLKKILGVDPGTWTDGTVIAKENLTNRKGEIVGVTADVWVEEGFYAKLYQAGSLEIGDEVECTLDHLYLTLHGNAGVKDKSEYYVTSRQFKKVEGKTSNSGYYKCNNCDGYYLKDEGYTLNNKEFICDGCMSHDYNVRDYVANIGMRK